MTVYLLLAVRKVKLKEKNKAKAISAKLLELNLKKNWKKRGKQDETRKNRKKQKNWREKTPKTGRNWMILKETARNMKKHEQAGRNRKTQEETARNSKNHLQTGKQ